MRRYAFSFGLGVFLVSAPAFADKFDSTLDISVAPTTTFVYVDGDRMRGQWMAPGATYRIGMSLEGFRFGAGIGFFGTPTSSKEGFRGPTWGVPIEIHVGYAFGHASSIQPFVDVRASAAHIFAPMTTTGDASEMVTGWGVSVMPRVGIRIPHGEYFFSEFTVGAGAGPERFQLSWSFGMPIPTANL